MPTIRSGTAPPGRQPHAEHAPAAAPATDAHAHPDFDLLVIGGGSGGFAAAIAAAEQGRRVGIVNRGPLGGHLHQPRLCPQQGAAACG